MARALAAAGAAPVTLRVAPSRKQKAASIALGCPAPKRQRIACRDPIIAAAGQGFVNWAVESPAQLDVTDVAAPIGPVLVAFQVPACALAFGEHLRLVGSCAELGNWDTALAPALEWAEGDTWTVAVALPPGHHAFKLVLMRHDGSPYWELGDDRSLQLPGVAAGSSSSSNGSSSHAAAAAAALLLSVTCSWGNTTLTEVCPDPVQLAAEAAAQQAAGPAVQQAPEGASSPSGPVLDMAQAHSDASIAIASHNIEALLACERQQLEAQQAQHVQQQHAVAEAAAAFADASAAVHEAQAAVLDAAASWAEDGPQSTAAGASEAAAVVSAKAAADSPPAAPVAPAAELPSVAAAAATGAPPAAAGSSSDTEQLFHFDSSSEGPSALQLARQQLVGRLPEEAAAGLEAALNSMNGAPGSRRQRAVLASLALHGPAVPAEQLYGVGSHERHPLAAHLDSPGQGATAEEAADEAEQLDSLAAQLGHRLSLAGGSSHAGSSASGSAGQAAAAGHKLAGSGRAADDPVLRGSFPGAAAYLAAQSLFTVGGLLWSAGRAAVPKAGRRVADAAVVLACTAAAAVALS
ncbi:hypothetical protein C2E21_7668 [Chlorella sorokiniana]|uniref:CBM20 domain-containing protein n=1 Tax=Chlorella sorokiniana TaxID=3076 RepID=A0A2P6TGW5_CHLSO|nr:hypothetical protein C2E21_7668 [Chlorella sorokiniana]|eukprot:PRW33525.1 hypothetical protein C2E21_7668 [Chlorella sorokiniana]